MIGLRGPNIVGTVGGAAGSTISTLSTTILASSAIGGPIGVAIGGIVAAVTSILGAIGVGSGCGQSCIAATNIVNQAEPLFQANLAAYQSGQISQATAIASYQALETQVKSACGAISGAAGQNCIGDRFTVGGCKWKDSNGNCWNWYIGYYLPLLQPLAGSTLPGGLTDTDLLIAGAVALAGLVMVAS